MVKKEILSCDRKKSLHIKTLKLFINRPKTLLLPMIAKKTGLPLHWLSKFAKIDNPSVNRVQVLYEFLSRSELFEE